MDKKSNYLQVLSLAMLTVLVGCTNIQVPTGRFDDDKYFCQTLKGYQSYIEYDAAEDINTDRRIDVRFCLEKGNDRIYFGWGDAKYREFVWSARPFSLDLAVERSCKLQSFPISTRGRYVKDSRIQVPSVRLRAFLDAAKESGEMQIQDCPKPVAN